MKVQARISCVLLLTTLLLPVGPVGAQATEIGQKIISAIKAGDDLADLKIFNPYYEPEGPGVASLRGCDFAIQPKSRPDELHVDWVCPDTKNNSFTRIYIPEGKLSRIEFQPSLNLMAPTKTGLALEKVPSRKEINRQFESAVRTGKDPTLGGLIPITADQFGQLKSMKGWNNFSTNPSGEYGAEIVWANNLQNPSQGADTTIHFDSLGRPIGLWIRTAPILTASAS